MTTLAAANSGRSDLLNSWDTNSDFPVGPHAVEMTSVAAPEPVSSAAAKLVGRTVTTLTPSLDLRVKTALPLIKIYR